MTSVTTDRRFGLNSGAAIKVPCDLATTANITLSGEQSIDGTTTAESRVFVKNQSVGTANGIYRTNTGSWVREPDFDGNRDILEGTLITVNRGSSNSDTMWRVTNVGAITVGSTSLTFERAAVNDSSTITFAPGGTGSVSSTVQTKLREWYDAIDDFGCDNTGATNTTTKLLAFYNACIAASKRGVIRAGTYKLTTGVLVFDNNFIDTTWPVIDTDGHDAVEFVVDSATATNAPVLTWKNGTANSPVGKYWRGGSHGGITISDSTGATAANRHGISMIGMWATQFGHIRCNDLRGDGIHCPEALYSSTNPDPYATSFIHFDCIEVNRAAGWAVRNLNWVGMDAWDVDVVNAIECVSGVWFGIGSGNRIGIFSVGSTEGWAFDDGTYAAHTGGSPQRNVIEAAEFDNVKNGIRLNTSTRTDFRHIRFVHRFQTSPNASALYWPLTAVDLAGGTGASCSNVKFDIQHRIEAGGVKGNLGVFTQANNTGNLLGCEINFDYIDNASFGLVDSEVMGTGYRLNGSTFVARKSRPLYDSRDRCHSIAFGSASSVMLNSGFGTAPGKIAFPSQDVTLASVGLNYNTTTSTFTAPRAGVYHVEVGIPMTLAVGTRVRLCLLDGTTTHGITYDYQKVDAVVQTYKLSYDILMTQGQTLIVTGDQNTGTASIAATPTNNREVRFVVREV